MAKKRSKKKQEQVQSTRQETTLQNKIGVDETIIRQAERELKSSKYTTPFKLSQRLGISVSIARKVLRELEKQGKAKLYSPGKRDPIYVSS